MFNLNISFGPHHHQRLPNAVVKTLVRICCHGYTSLTERQSFKMIMKNKKKEQARSQGLTSSSVSQMSAAKDGHPLSW
jgi:hypothetical protein